MLAMAGNAAAAERPFWRVVRISGSDLGCLEGRPEAAVEVVACDEACTPIPWQLDERDANGELALADGPQPNRDEPQGVIDANDELFWMAADGGRRARPGELPSSDCARELEVGSGDDRMWVYAVVVPAPARRSPVRYVEYDPVADVVRAARVAIGFGAATPRYLALRDGDGNLGPNLLDRLKVRASAWFLGLIPLGRTEDDMEWQFDAWRAGPIRVVRRERQWVRLGWGLRTPIFRTETVVYRDFIELPVRLRLNFPPTYFFHSIEVQAALDFRALGSWTVRAPGAAGGTIGALDRTTTKKLNAIDGDWIALSGPDLTLVLRLQLGESFASLRRQLLYRENDDGAGPESAPGEHPAIGFRLTDWSHVDRGTHWFAAIATALPPGYDVERFIREDATAPSVDVRDVGAAGEP